MAVPPRSAQRPSIVGAGRAGGWWLRRRHPFSGNGPNQRALPRSRLCPLAGRRPHPVTGQYEGSRPGQLSVPSLGKCWKSTPALESPERCTEPSWQPYHFQLLPWPRLLPLYPRGCGAWEQTLGQRFANFWHQGPVSWKIIFPWVRVGDGLGMIQVHYIYCAFYFYYY